MAGMSNSDKVAVISGCCGETIRKMIDQGYTPLAIVDVVNDVMQTQGWGRFATEDLVRMVSKPNSTTEKTVSIEYRTLVNGQNTKHMGVEEFLQAIKQTDDEIKRLTDLAVDSVTVNKTIDNLKADRETLVKLLDEQHGEDSSD